MPRSKSFARFSTAAVACVLLPAIALAFPPKEPFDPRPVMAQALKGITADKFSFVVMGDSKCNPGFTGLLDRAEALKPSHVLLIGDMVPSAVPKNYDQFERQLSPFARKMALWPCVGNHDVGGLQAKQFPLYVKFWGIDSKHYTFDVRNCRFITLDAAMTQPTKDELTWFEEQLAQGKKAGKHLFVWQHVPSYTIGVKPKAEIPGRPTAFTRLCTKYGVVADFAGHDHSYYRTHRDGVTYIIQALGGAGIYEGKRIAEAIEGDSYVIGTGGGATKIRTPAGEKTGRYELMLTAIHVDGDKITGTTMTASGEVVEEFPLVPPPRPAPATQPATAPAGAAVHD
ncbi:MAG: metallophosphoesterase [Planctomycetaceae bacterium]|nr:metallophosphoesterase [Planctomycetaceae bacterium]